MTQCEKGGVTSFSTMSIVPDLEEVACSGVSVNDIEEFNRRGSRMIDVRSAKGAFDPSGWKISHPARYVNTV